MVFVLQKYIPWILNHNFRIEHCHLVIKFQVKHLKFYYTGYRKYLTFLRGEWAPDNVLTHIVFLRQVEELADTTGSLGAQSSRHSLVGQAWDFLFSWFNQSFKWYILKFTLFHNTKLLVFILNTWSKINCSIPISKTDPLFRVWKWFRTEEFHIARCLAITDYNNHQSARNSCPCKRFHSQ